MRVVTWNLDYWKHRSVHDEAWRWLIDEIRPDIALLQECVPPDWVCANHVVLWEPAYPGGKQPWGTAVVTRGLPTTPATLNTIEDWLARLGSTPANARSEGAARLKGWCVSANVEVAGRGSVLVVGLHNPSFPIERSKLYGMDLAGIKLTMNEDLWLLDAVSWFLKDQLHRPVLLGGDFNSSRLLDDLYGPRGNHELFDRLGARGFVSLHRKFNSADEQTYFRRGGAPHQLDYLFADYSLAHDVTRCDVVPYAQVERFSDHAPLIAEVDGEHGD